jgi:RNA polymerase sigma factor (TIGR02999 family)
MRRILVDHARARRASKRGGGEHALSLGQVEAGAPGAETEKVVDVLDLNDALERLAELDASQARLVELRYFTGLTIEETAEAMEMSPATVKREWAIARAWLRREIGE